MCSWEHDVINFQWIGSYTLAKWHTHDGSMVLVWCAMDPINISPMLAYIPAPWILWDSLPSLRLKSPHFSHGLIIYRRAIRATLIWPNFGPRIWGFNMSHQGSQGSKMRQAPSFGGRKLVMQKTNRWGFLKNFVGFRWNWSKIDGVTSPSNTTVAWASCIPGSGRGSFPWIFVSPSLTLKNKTTLW